MCKKDDEIILEILKRSEIIEEKRNIKDEQVQIGERYYIFEETEFFDGKLKIFIPNSFEDMAEESRRIKYISENRPEIIKCNEDGSIAITFKLIESPLNEENVEKLTKGMKTIIQRFNPSNVFYTLGVEVIEAKNIGIFDFKSSAIDDFLYNIMFFFELEGKTVMGTFSCRYSELDDWKDIAFQMIRTIRIIL